MLVHGLITAMVTPFEATGAIDYEATERLVNRLIEEGVKGLFILGTNGEAASLSQAEKVAFARFVMGQVAGRVPVIIGVGECGTGLTLQLMDTLAPLEPAAFSVISPYFQRLSEDELYQHFFTLSRAGQVPLLLYNMPQLTGNPITLELYLRLITLEGIVGIKDSAGNLEQLLALIAATPAGKGVYVGSDSLYLAARQAGALGGVSGLSNAIAPVFLALDQALAAGDSAVAQAQQDQVNDFRLAMKVGTAPAMIKATLAQEGVIAPYTRLPISSLLSK